MIWVVFALLTGIAVLSILWPLAKERRLVVGRPIDIAFYQAQIADIDRDVERGLMGPSDADSVRAEAARRLMAVAQRPTAMAAASQTSVLVAGLIAILIVPAIAVVLYAKIGNPQMPDEPLEARLNAGPGTMDVMIAVAKMETYLEKHPDDGRGYEVLAPIYLRLGRSEDAARAFAQALRLLGETAARRAAYAEALVYAANGVVTAEARESFDKALAEDASSPSAAFYLGLVAEQEGNNQAAREIWQKLLARSPTDAAWVPALRTKLADTVAPDAAVAAQISALPRAAQQTAVRGMVEGLASRLARNGQDIDGWLRLIRAYRVLNESAKAHQALTDARRNLANDSTAIARIDGIARELGLDG